MELFLPRLDDDPNEPVNDLARPFISDPARPSEPERDLKREDLSEKLEAIVSEPLRDL